VRRLPGQSRGLPRWACNDGEWYGAEAGMRPAGATDWSVAPRCSFVSPGHHQDCPAAQHGQGYWSLFGVWRTRTSRLDREPLACLVLSLPKRRFHTNLAAWYSICRLPFMRRAADLGRQLRSKWEASGDSRESREETGSLQLVRTKLIKSLAVYHTNKHAARGKPGQF
jgi:hypothetical protein